MPNEKTVDPTAKPPVKVITNDPSIAGLNLQGTSGQQDDFTGERVDLPSKGLLYADNNPAKQGWILVRPMTTKEEEILVTERFHKQGVVIDLILSRCIMTKGINTLDLLSGDRLHILFYLRAISYGPDYSFKTRMGDGSIQEIKTNVSKLAINHLPDGFAEPWNFQFEGKNYELRLSRGKDEQDSVLARMAEKKKNPKAPDSSTTDSLRRQIVSIDGDESPEVIAKAVGKMVTKVAHAIRAEIASKNPGPQVRIDVENADGEQETVTVAITESFFRP